MKKEVSVDYLCNERENQYFDRKSARIKPTEVARHLVAFSNANGGILAIGIEDNGTITGFNYDKANSINDFFVCSIFMLPGKFNDRNRNYKRKWKANSFIFY